MPKSHATQCTSAMSADRDVIAALAAKQAITEQLHSYSRGLDRMDRTLAERVWHADGTADYGPGYRGSGSGFLDFVWEYHAGFRAHSHLVSNALIDVDLESGTAVSETYVAVWLQTIPVDGTVTDQQHRGRYLDRWSLREGRWAIDHRTYVADILYQGRHAAIPDTKHSAPSGTRDRTDLSYPTLGL
ncbi:nuclear transport factor 2 family protein [Nocardia jiangxiensis]|uniref:nuclear transport factor 2 family protein n=1 Tax=Nocardia jiangxiensis TaxID=282685 RepID=UPI0003199690|nr:nuclear transport factor 2 family protein [Nocardia jiangxiensis]